MVKTAVKVFLRTRPTATSGSGIKIGQDGQSVSVNVPKDQSAGLINNQQEMFSFKFDGVLENVSQEEAYTTVAHEVVDSLMSGYNGTIFCYGQTGAGKTFTMSGGNAGYAHRGIIPRALHHIFREIDLRVDKMFRVHVSYLEIYNEQLYDLLSESPGTSDSMAVLEDSNNNAYVSAQLRFAVAVAVTVAGSLILVYGFLTDAGLVEPCRSHTVFTVHVEMRTSEAASERAILSKLNLVDLAGSERTKKTGVTGQTLKEAQFINRSLSFLEQTVNALSRKDTYVPFRQTKLTAVLRDALGGNCKTVMVANVWGEPSHTEETLSTLRFASRVRTLTTDLAVNESNDPGLLLRRYERQIRELKQELAMRDTLSGRARVSYDDLTDDELRDLHATARRFLAGEADAEELPADSIKRVREAYKALRAAHAAMKSEMATQLANLQRATEDGAAVVRDGAARSRVAPGVGDLDLRTTGGFTVGQAPLDSRPPPPRSELGDHSHAHSHAPLPSGAPSPSGPGPALKAQSSHHFPADGASAYGDVPTLDSPSIARGSGAAAATRLAGIFTVPGDRNAVFRRYKSDFPEGRELTAALKAASAALRETRGSIKSLGDAVNGAKRRIDELTAAVAQRRSGGVSAPPPGGDAEVLDGETYALVQELKALKAQYRADFDALKAAREQLEPYIQAVAVARAALLEAFDRWAATQSDATLRRLAAAGRNGSGGGAPGEEEDELDAGEAFERMQLARITERDPDSLAYHSALRRTAAGPPGSHGMGRPPPAGASGGNAKAAAAATRRMEATQAVNRGLAR
ncbi:Kif9 type kinesin [Volvox carteri f. nagariensis]|uniref:Kinesin-like protein n=1 Tax=Volvox carteri f. nagariensis TaxID=3068 RepID=D8TPW0_VOLCA|nr:Kif9 type kinesin [Volvox carteri f. nagariensis]EFJ50296.1 Kif9 type kinesin [Volvox carteri f. nagariensis]|eukprot:XP_002948421.1 Kif9 type kinesin [Volvox carteri f. nagariensis]